MHSSCGIQRLLSHALSNAEKVLSPTPDPRIRTPLGVDEGSGVQRDVIRAAYRQAGVLNDIKCTRYVAPANARVQHTAGTGHAAWHSGSCRLQPSPTCHETPELEEQSSHGYARAAFKSGLLSGTAVTARIPRVLPLAGLSSFPLRSVTPSTAISIRHLRKTFNTSHWWSRRKSEVEAVADLTLDIPKSGIFVLLGSNGCVAS